MTWRRIYALLSHHYSFSIDQINDMTMVQVSLYISQIQWVSPLERIRYYLRDIKHVLFSYFIKDYQADPEYDEDEDEQNHAERELIETQRLAKLHGIPLPTR